MREFATYTGVVVPIDCANVDTDVIIPKQYLKSVERTGFGVNLFDSWRYLDSGKPGQDHSCRRINPDFILNQPDYANASILLARNNFGCGSSREHAVWALKDYGIDTVIAPSYSDIFYNNAVKNGLLPVQLEAEDIDTLFVNCTAQRGYRLTVNLLEQNISDATCRWKFTIDDFIKACLLKGLDEISLTLEHSDEIRAYEEKRMQQAPWLFIGPR